MKDFEIRKAVVVCFFCDLLLNRRTATWNLFVNYTENCFGLRLAKSQGTLYLDFSIVQKVEITLIRFKPNIPLIKAMFY